MIVYNLVAESLPGVNQKGLSQHLTEDSAHDELMSGKFKVVSVGSDYVRYYYEYKPYHWQNVVVQMEVMNE